MNKDFILPFPGVIRIEPASLCNLRCRNCPTGTIKTKQGIMSKGTFSIIFDQLKKNKDKIRVVVLYHGGEPFLNKDFISMLKKIKKLGIPFVKTVSNGMLLTESLSNELIDSDLDSIEISLDGKSPEENNFIRRNSDFDTVVKNIRLLIKCKHEKGSKKPKIFIATTQFLYNKLDIPDSIPKVPEYLLKEFSEEHKNGEIDFKTTYAYVWPEIKLDENIYEIYSDPSNSPPKKICDHVNSTITIRWNGDVVPCCYDLTSICVMGNIHEQEISEIWNNEKYIELRKGIHEMKFNFLCKDCNVVKNEKYLILKQKT